MQSIDVFRLIAYLYVVVGMGILAWGMSVIRHSLAKGFAALLVSVAINNVVLMVMLGYSLIGGNLQSVTADVVWTLNAVFMAIVTTVLLVIFRRMSRMR